MLFSDIRADVYARLGLSTSPASAAVTRLNRFINEWHRRVLSKPGLTKYRNTIITFASVADQPEYGLRLSKVNFIHERTTDHRLIEKGLEWYRTYVPDPTAFSGVADYWVPAGRTRILRRPTSAAELFALSSSGSDTSTIRAEVVRSNGYPRSLSATLTGTTKVSLGSAITDVIDVIGVYLSAAAVGAVSLYAGDPDASGVVIATIPIGAIRSNYQRIFLAPTPSDARTYTVDGLADLTDIEQDNDEPLFHQDFHDILVKAAVYEEWMNLGRRAEARDLRADLEEQIKDLRAFSWQQPESGATVADLRRPEEYGLNLPVAD